jgi:alpha-D-ribose 1-methylphosphonate 5-triphosphate synthase subunit PhnH
MDSNIGGEAATRNFGLDKGNVAYYPAVFFPNEARGQSLICQVQAHKIGRLVLYIGPGIENATAVCVENRPKSQV